MAAAAAGDADRLGRMLHPGVELTVDGGGVVAAPRFPLTGRSDVGRHLAGVLIDPEVSLRVASVNGMPGVVVCRADAVTGVLGIRLRGRLIVQAWLVVNPDKLRGWKPE